MSNLQIEAFILYIDYHGKIVIRFQKENYQEGILMLFCPYDFIVAKDRFNNT